MAKGIRRIKDGWGDQDSVLVKYSDGAEMEIPASQYVAQGHHPPIDALPAALFFSASLSQSDQSRCTEVLTARSARST
jgi:hypothetical protein